MARPVMAVAIAVIVIAVLVALVVTEACIIAAMLENFSKGRFCDTDCPYRVNLKPDEQQ